MFSIPRNVGRTRVWSLPSDWSGRRGSLFMLFFQKLSDIHLLNRCFIFQLVIILVFSFDFEFQRVCFPETRGSRTGNRIDRQVAHRVLSEMQFVGHGPVRVERNDQVLELLGIDWI